MVRDVQCVTQKEWGLSSLYDSLRVNGIAGLQFKFQCHVGPGNLCERT